MNASFRPNSAHWGSFEAAVQSDGYVEVRPHPLDPHPSPLLANISSALHHPTRVARPAIRRGWLEAGPGPTDGRGSEDFVEVGWDEALDLVANELARVRGEHGNESIFGGSYGWASAGRFHHAQSQVHRFLNGFGGFVRSVHTYSNGCSAVLLPHVVGSSFEVLRRGTTWETMLDNTTLIVAFGGFSGRNTYVAPGGVTRHDSLDHAAESARRGIDVEIFSPLRDDVVAGMNAHWHPLTPGTDTAVMLGLSHVLISEGLVDEAFLERYCVGYDRLRDYVMGTGDGTGGGVAKTAHWAAELSGLQATTLVALARRMAAERTMVSVTWSLQRTPFGEQPVWMGIALAAMLGQIGLPGGGFSHGYGSMADSAAPWSDTPMPSLAQGRNPVDLYIPVARIADLLLKPGEVYEFDGETNVYPDIRLLYWAGGNPFHHHQDLQRLRRALGRLDTFIVHEPYWTATARHADVVLPGTVSLERDDLGAGRKDPFLIAMHCAVPPHGESRDDYAIFAGLAERLGFVSTFTEGRDARGWLEHLYEGWRGGVGANLTDVFGKPLPSFEGFWDRGWIEFGVSEEERLGTSFCRFRADPDAAPLRTPSGRIELYSEVIAGFGYDDCPPHPTWIEPPEWLGAPLASTYPLHLIANQPSSRLHSQLDVGDVSLASKVAGREPVRLNPDDAGARGIADGDIVRVWNDRGACLAGAVLSSAIRPGVVQLSTGAWYDPVGDGSLCAHGNVNMVTADRPTSRLAQGCTGQHALVEVSRFEGEPPPVRAHQPPQFGTLEADPQDAVS